jgi:hypothetical protein
MKEQDLYQEKITTISKRMLKQKQYYNEAVLYWEV